MHTIRTMLAAAVAAGAALAVVGPVAPAQAATERISTGDSKVFVIDGNVYSVSLGDHEIEWGDPLSATQTGDLRVRKFQPRSGGDTARFGLGDVLDITGTAPTGQYLGEPYVFPIRSGLLFCRVNPSDTESGRTWSVDTAVYSTADRSWSALRRTPVPTSNGQYGACLGGAGEPGGYTAIVGKYETERGQSLFALTSSGSGPLAVRAYTHDSGWVTGASASINVNVAVNAATGVVDLYEDDKIPVTVNVTSRIRSNGELLRRVERRHIVFFDVSRGQWTSSRQVFSAGFDATERVVGDTVLGDARAVVSSDGATLHVVAGFKRISAVPEWPDVPVTSVGRLPDGNVYYGSTIVVGLRPEDAARRDWQATQGWTLTYADDAGDYTIPVSIFRQRSASLVLFVGFSAATTPVGTVRDARLAFTGDREGTYGNAEPAWTRLMQRTEQGVLARSLRGDDLSAVTTLPGVRSENGHAETDVRHTAVIDGVPVIIIDEEDSQSRDRLTSSSLIDGSWTRPQVVVSRYQRGEYDEPVGFMPYLGRTALIGAQSPAAGADAPRSEAISGIIRRVFADGRWGGPEYIRPLASGDSQTVPAVARVLGSDGPVEVEIFTQNPSVAITGATFDADERVNGSPWGTITFTYRGTLPQSARGFAAVQGWTGALGWQIGFYASVTDERERTLKAPTPMAPAGPVPTTPARIVWTEMLETAYVVDRRL